jgi:hypothetical protein
MILYFRASTSLSITEIVVFIIFKKRYIFNMGFVPVEWNSMTIFQHSNSKV